MGAFRDRRQDDRGRTKWVVENGTLVVTPERRAPSTIVTQLVEIIEARVVGADIETPVRALVDIRDSSFAPSGHEIRLGAVRLADLDTAGRIALLVSDDFQFGLARMLGILSEESGFEIQPFKEAAAADSWLRDSD